MQQIRLRTVVRAGKPLEVELPEDFEEGPVEVIIVGDREGTRGAEFEAVSIEDFLDESSLDHLPARTKDSIDQEIERERSSWD